MGHKACDMKTWCNAMRDDTDDVTTIRSAGERMRVELLSECARTQVIFIGTRDTLQVNAPYRSVQVDSWHHQEEISTVSRRSNRT